MCIFCRSGFGSGPVHHRRDFLRGAAALGAAALLQPLPALAQSGGAYARLSARGEFIIRNAYVLTMDEKLGDLPSGDIHVRNGAIIAVTCAKVNAN